MKVIRVRVGAALATVALALLAFPLLVHADDISNTLDGSVDAVAEVMPLNVGGTNGTTQLVVIPSNGDGKNGCNLTGSATLVVSLASSNTGVATVSPASVTFGSCGDSQTVTVTPQGVGSATISATQVSNSTSGTFNLVPATFTVTVAPPLNTAPQIAVAGVAGGATYDKGAVPAATCQVTDAEDGNSSFAATLSAITGTHAADGIGTQTASCAYTDAGGLMVSAGETYSIQDPSAPSISYVLIAASPDGENGWYVSDVSLTWDVEELESPLSLSVTGCVDQIVVADQLETEYPCAATSAGGDAAPVAVSIKRDATAPGLDLVGGPQDGETYDFGTVPGEPTCDASDATSGVAGSCEIEGYSTAFGLHTLTATVEDNAGNETTVEVSYEVVDPTPPSIDYTLNPADPDGDGGWYVSDVTLTWDVDEPESPETLDLTGCVDQLIDADQLETEYPCSATSAGGAAGPVTVSIKRDATAPGLDLVGGPQDGEVYDFGTVPAEPGCDASDATSGVAGPCEIEGYSTTVGVHTLTATVEDNAGNETTVEVSYEVVDPTPPSIDYTLAPAGPDGEDGWYVSDVTLTWDVDEPESPETLELSGCVDQLVDADQIETEYPCSATSAGGTSGSVVVSIKRDATAPDVSFVGGPQNGGSYSIGEVPDAPTCEATDATSGLAGDCEVAGYSTALGTHTMTATARDNAGNETIVEATYEVFDPTPPSVDYALAPELPEGEDGWYTGDVSLTWTVTEPESPETLDLTGCLDQNVVADQVETEYHCTAASAGGITGPVTVSIKRDATAPDLDLVGGPQDGETYDFGSVPAMPTCEASDATSGIAAPCEVEGYSTALGVHTITATVRDNAGHERTVDVTYEVIDPTPPAIDYTLSPADPDGDNGWYVGDVSLTWDVSEPESPESLETTGCVDQLIDADQPDTEYSCAATSAGGASGPVTVTIKRDATAPDVSLVGGPSDGASYYFGSVPAAPTCTASDLTSGIAGSCAVSGYSTAVGVHTVQATVEDNAGNESSVSRTYTVQAWTLRGFYQPVDMGGVLNTVKGGSTVPLKFEVFAGPTELTSPSVVQSLRYSVVSCSAATPTDELELVATGGTVLRYDASAGQFTYNWQTPKTPGACLKVTVTMQDGSSLVANFKLK